MSFRSAAKKLFLGGLLPLLAALPTAASSDDGKSALVIIDMQPMFSSANRLDENAQNKRKLEAILQAQIEAIAEAKRVGMPIIFIEYDHCGKTHSRLVAAAAGYQNQGTYLKTTDGMFDDESLKESLNGFLRSKRVSNLIITGANGGACVRSSIEGALKQNYNVVAYVNAIADFNYEKFIYPYVDHFDDIVPECKNCALRQARSQREAFSAQGKDAAVVCGRKDGNLIGVRAFFEEMFRGVREMIR